MSGLGIEGSLASWPKVMKNGDALVLELTLVLYANCIGAMYIGQSMVVLSTKDDKYLAIVLFINSAELLDCG